MGINYIVGDASRPLDSEASVCVIAHICNDIGAWGRGFVLALSKMSPLPERQYREWAKGHTADGVFRLGAVQLVRVNEHFYVANMVAQHGLRSRENPVPLRLDALSQCLQGLAAFCASLSSPVQIQMPRIGTGLAGGRWSDIEPLLQDTLASKGFNVVVCDFPEKSHHLDK